MDKTKQKLIIIDGNALIHRSFHALPPTLATKSGEMVNAVYGFTAVLIKSIREFKPNYIVLTLDKAAPTFRHKEFKEYKAHRVKAPDELYNQISRVKEVAEAFNIPIYEKDGFEADDLIGTIANAVDGNIEKIIVTGDLDALQLINEQTKVYTMRRGLTDSVIYDSDAVKQRYGLSPEQMIDYKSLRGDPSDNIPGVRGIGEKTATELLQKFKTLEGVYKHITSNNIKSRIAELLKKNKGDAFMSKRLATIKCDVDIKFDVENTRFSGVNYEKIIKLFGELEFKSLLERVKNIKPLENQKAGTFEQDGESDKFERNKKNFRYYLIDNEKKFNNFLQKLKQQKEFAFDTETSSLDPLTAELLGISFSWKSGEAYYLSIMNYHSLGKRSGAGELSITNEGDDLFSYKSGIKNPQPRQAKRDRQELRIKDYWIKELKLVLEDGGVKKFGHNIKYDIKVMACNGINVQGAEFDTMVASYLLNPGTRQHGLDALAFTELGYQKITKEDLLRKGKEKIRFADVDVEKMSSYSCEDADFTYRLAKKLEIELKKQKLDKLFNEIEMPVVYVLSAMELNGIKINVDFLNELSKAVNKKIYKIEEEIYEQAKTKFNIKSTLQLKAILFEKLEIPTENIAKTKTGFSTAADELEKLKEHHPIIRLIQKYRELTKLSSTYIEALPKLVNSKTGRLHTSFNQSVTATGRLSSSEPNLQNIPVRTELGREIRKAFVADTGNKLLALDYSQIELRLAAHMSNDKKMIKAFLNGADIHRMTAAEINQISPEDVTDEMRRQAKAVNFGVLYGQGPRGLAQGADIPYARAKEFIDQYFIAYKDIKKFIGKTIEQARKNGYAETLFNRRRYLPEINSSMAQVRKAAERMATNMPIQGTAADMIKIAMINVYDFIKNNSDIKMLLQVHDELLFEVKDSEVKKIAGQIKNIMENAIKLRVPVVVDAKAGDNWGEMESITN